MTAPKSLGQNSPKTRVGARYAGRRLVEASLHDMSDAVLAEAAARNPAPMRKLKTRSR